MSDTIHLDTSHIPLLCGFLATFQAHIEELLIRFSRLSELRDNVPESDSELRRHMNILLWHCSLELDWSIRAYETYRELRDMVQPSSSELAALWAGAYGL
ncbi:hypothetical protein FLAG1_06687 [Fusarium langsethiae]|uniref:Uncharacterized protein n=1 Tax=Fusarium langsethiae TaxID=179993 RepID=A0A0M9EVN9_FUSLA|nr:hypothetical protein FLAG1_06687 [Fusarium langsethiae]GKU04269.1 unnamed protein product [Fusarium langsethiae]GKU19913.1 unnamed protein product [Fusarium langsethiae]